MQTTQVPPQRGNAAWREPWEFAAWMVPIVIVGDARRTKGRELLCEDVAEEALLEVPWQAPGQKPRSLAA
jgi:hypothetical protein